MKDGALRLPPAIACAPGPYPFRKVIVGAGALVLAVLVAWLLWDGRRQRALLAELEARGVRRRSRG